MGTSPIRSPAPRRRVSHRRYQARRAGAVVVVGAFVYGMVRIAGALGGSGDERLVGAGGSSSVPEPVRASVPALSAGSSTGSSALGSASSEPTVDTDAPSTPAPTTVVPTTDAFVGAPDADHPATVYVAGDSDAGTFGPYLEQLLDATGMIETELEYKVSSGLSRPDFFDWPNRFRNRLPVVDPEIVVVTFGGNDAQGIAVASGEFIYGDPVAESAEWSAEYTRRAGEVMDLLAADGRTVIWVGIPNDNNPEVTARMQVQDEAAKAAAADRPDVVFVDTWARFSGRDGNWAEYVVDPRDRQGKDVRADDGFHLNEVGAEILALDIAELIKADLRERGAQI